MTVWLLFVSPCGRGVIPASRYTLSTLVGLMHPVIALHAACFVVLSHIGNWNSWLLRA